VRLPNIKIGRIVRLKLTMDKHGSNMDRNPKQVEVICTLWPDSDNVLQPHEIAIDDTVVVGSRMDWTRCSCKVCCLDCSVFD
jgi:ribosome biogenesis SPOUT family RNA methylase Rps3